MNTPTIEPPGEQRPSAGNSEPLIVIALAAGSESASCTASSSTRCCGSKRSASGPEMPNACISQVKVKLNNNQYLTRDISTQ